MTARRLLRTCEAAVSERSRSQDCPLQILKNAKGKRANGIGAALPGSTFELRGSAAAAAASARDAPPSGWALPAARALPAAWTLPAAPRLPRR